MWIAIDQAVGRPVVDDHESDCRAGFVPSCAMKVNHTSELGALVVFKPALGCGCFYEQKVNNKTSCGGPGDCPSTAPACNYGYRETQ